jgi:hypothetical protein
VTEPGQPTRLHAAADDDLAERLWDYEAFDIAAERPPSEATTGLIDLGFIRKALRRSRWLWCTLAAIGVLAGGYLLVTSKPAYQVTVSLLMAEPPGVDPSAALATDAILAQDPRVATLAAKKLGISDATGLADSYKASFVSNPVLNLSVSASSPSLAAGEATALAEAFLEFRAKLLTSAQQAMSAAQDQQVTQDQQQISALQSQVNQASSASERSALQTKLANATSALTALQQWIATNRSSGELGVMTQVNGSKILYSTPPAANHSKKRYLIEYVGGGLFVGLTIGIAIIAIRAVVSDKLFRRDDVARALDAPVPISVTSGLDRRFPPQLSGRGSREADVGRVSAYLQEVVEDVSRARHPASLAIVAVDKTVFAASVVAELVASCAQDGKRVIVADMADGTLARLLGTSQPGTSAIDVAGQRMVLAVGDPATVAPVGPRMTRGRHEASIEGLSAAYSAADVFITFLVLDPAIGAEHLRTWADEAVAIVTAGRSSVARVQALGEMVRHANVRLVSGVLVGADKDDESLGLVTT